MKDLQGSFADLDLGRRVLLIFFSIVASNGQNNSSVLNVYVKTEINLK